MQFWFPMLVLLVRRTSDGKAGEKSLMAVMDPYNEQKLLSSWYCGLKLTILELLCSAHVHDCLFLSHVENAIKFPP